MKARNGPGKKMTAIFWFASAWSWASDYVLARHEMYTIASLDLDKETDID